MFFLFILSQSMTGPISVAKSKKILILTSNGGTGQQSICQSMYEYLGEYYALSKINVTTEVMNNFDPLSSIHKNLNTEIVYNWLIKKNYFLLLNAFVRFGGFLMKHLLSNKIQAVFDGIFTKEIPDIIISLVPYYNAYAIKSLARHIPYIIVCCDIDITGYLFDWPKIHFANLCLCMPVEPHENSGFFQRRQIQPKQIHILGYPLRKIFSQKWLVRPKDQTITLLLGGQGSEKCLQYLTRLLAYKTAITINVCIGHNKPLAAKILKLPIPSHIVLNVIHFTDNIASILMDSDLLITKTGSCSIFEALYLHKPILMDCTSTQLFWEKANVDYINQLGVGLPVNRLDDCVSTIETLLDSEAMLEAIRVNYSKLTLPAFFSKFIHLLNEKIVPQLEFNNQQESE